ncbi:MAG: sensor histidine kinase [Lachnospiraceae bacterium]|nr:sensor histidine kinase [Lachnospiraceae bacterium]
MRHSIKSQITLATVIITLFITFLMASICYFTFQSLLKTSLIQSTQFSLRQAFTPINTNLENLMRLSAWANENPKILSYFSGSQQNNSNKLDAYNRLNEEYKSNKANDYISRIIISDIEGHFIQEVRTVMDTSAQDAIIASSLSCFNTLLSAPSFEWVGIIDDPHTKSPGKQVIPLIRPLHHSYRSDMIGWIYLAISTSLITDALKNYPLHADSDLYLTVGEKTYLVESNSLLEIIPSYQLISQSENSVLVEDHNGKRHTIVSINGIEGWYLSQSLSEQEFSSQKQVYYTLLLIACFIIFGLGILLTLFLNRIINVPIRSISKKMNEISQGNFSYDPSIEWEHELGDIGKGINRLSKDVVTLMDKRVEDEKQKKELEYQILQSQINPHFLYNTLNSIKWMATIQNATGIAEMTTSLARLLKSISKGTRQLIPIREELELLKDYVLIQNYRYGGIVKVDYSIPDETLLGYVIPKLTLQPIVENAIFHGIEAKGENGIITVTLYKKEQDLYIDITDNGIGMSPELINQVLSGSSEDAKSDFFRKVGIHNVNLRLKYTFGENYGIQIHSKEGEYTTMIIILPLRKEEKHA